MDDMKFKESLMEKYDGVNRNAWKKYNSILKGANIRSINFDIKFKDYLPFYNTPCYYCGRLGAIGLDRLDSSIGYESSNIVSCCSTCNIMKGTLNPNDYIFQCKKIAGNPQSFVYDKPLQELINKAEQQIIIKTLELTGNDKEKTIKILQISRASFYNKLNKHKINISTLQKSLQ